MTTLRHNVLDLIGAHTGRYHSALITCYSFDFIYFEERILPALRRANIKNVVVLADGNFIEQALDNKTGREFAGSHTYSLGLIFARQVFHPKIMLLAGKQQGLLLIGSGNLTASGISCNDEIWSAFHLENHTLPHAGLFAHTWTYLQQFFPQVRGFATTQISWFTQFAPWLPLLSLPDDAQWCDLPSGDAATFIGQRDKPIIEQVSELILPAEVIELTVISPYFDQDGHALQILQQRFQPERTQCLLDLQSDLLPDQLPASLHQIDFFAWPDCVQDFDDRNNRLHAKAIHFRLKNGTQYLLLGSANATAPGLGINGVGNEEACILLKRASGNHFLEELGININKQAALTPANFKRPRHIQASGKTSPRGKVRILCAEMMANELMLYLNWPEGFAIPKARVQVQGQWDEVLLETWQETGQQNLKILLPENDQIPHTVQIYGEDGMSLSSRALIHRVESLARCNPDPALAKFGEAMEKAAREGDEALAQLFHFLDFSWVDEEENNGAYTRTATLGARQTLSRSGADYAQLSAEDFNTVDASWEAKTMAYFNDHNYQVAEFLVSVGKGLIHKQNDEDLQSGDLVPLDTPPDDNDNKPVGSTKRREGDGLVLQKSIHRFLEKLTESYESHLFTFIQQRNLKDFPAQKTTIKQLSNLQIALTLFQQYCGATFEVGQDTDNINGVTIEKSYLPLTGDWANVDNLKVFLVECLGRFLLCCTPGFQQYDTEVVQQRIEHQRQEAFTQALFWILNCPWIDKDRHHFNLLSLNALHFLCPDFLAGSEWLDKLERHLDKLKQEAKVVSPVYPDNWKRFKNGILPLYSIWRSLFDDPESRKSELVTDTASLSKEQIIFSSKMGFNRLYHHRTSGNQTLLSLVRPGYYWEEECYDFILRDVAFGAKAVLYR